MTASVHIWLSVGATCIGYIVTQFWICRTNQLVLQKGKSAEAVEVGQVEDHLEDLDRLGPDGCQNSWAEVEWFGLKEEVQLLQIGATDCVVCDDLVVELTN